MTYPVTKMNMISILLAVHQKLTEKKRVLQKDSATKAKSNYKSLNGELSSKTASRVDVIAFAIPHEVSALIDYYFYKLFTRNIIDLIVEQTNLYSICTGTSINADRE